MSTRILRSVCHGFENRPAKRRRISANPPLGSISNLKPHAGNRPHRHEKRKRSEAFADPMPSALAPRKRRRPSILRTDAVGQPPVAKRMRVTLEDVEMADVNNASCGQRKSRSRRRKVLLRDVLRKEKFSRAYWQQVVVQGSNVNAAHSNSAVQHPAQEIRGAEASEAGDRGAHDFLREDETKLTGEEEVCEVIDASENVEPNANFGAGYQSAAFGGPAAEPSVQAVLLDNGLCAVQITRADGSTQSVIIQPPESGDDVW